MWTRNGDMSSQAFCFCNNCRGEVRCHQTAIQRDFERDILSGSLESNDVSFATQATGSECGIKRGSPDVALSDRTSEECHDFFGSRNLSE